MLFKITYDMHYFIFLGREKRKILVQVYLIQWQFSVNIYQKLHDFPYSAEHKMTRRSEVSSYTFVNFFKLIQTFILMLCREDISVSVCIWR